MLGLSKQDRVEIDTKVLEKIDKVDEKELPELWKKFFVKAKSFKKNSKNFIQYMSIADHIYIKHYYNTHPEELKN